MTTTTTPAKRIRRQSTNRQPVTGTRPMTLSDDFIKNSAAHIILAERADGTLKAFGPFANYSNAVAWTEGLATFQVLPLFDEQGCFVPGRLVRDPLDRWIAGPDQSHATSRQDAAR